MVGRRRGRSLTAAHHVDDVGWNDLGYHSDSAFSPRICFVYGFI